MKALKDKALIYDSNCPLCCWYTDKFIQVGALDENGRISFNDLDESSVQQLDAHRGRHEIPLLDKQTGKVLYGIDGLTTILANMFPVFAPVLKNEFAKQLVRPLYSFISYNRRIIVPSKIAANQKIDCAPDFHFGWRVSLIAVCFALFCSIIIVTRIQLDVLGVNLFLAYPLFHILFILLITKNDWKQKLWNALGDFAVTNLSTTLLFTPLFSVNYFIAGISMYYIIVVFVLMQIRLILHFEKRIENKNYW